MSFLSSRFNASSEENRDPSTGSYAGVPPPSVFGIIVVGLLAGLVVGRFLDLLDRLRGELRDRRRRRLEQTQNTLWRRSMDGQGR